MFSLSWRLRFDFPNHPCVFPRIDADGSSKKVKERKIRSSNMSRGKKSKRKTGERRKRQEAEIVAGALRSVDNDGSSVQSTNQSRTFDQITTTTTSPDDSSRSETVEIDEKSGSGNDPNLALGDARQICAMDGPRCSASLTILFKNDELQTLRSVLQKTDLSRTPLLLGAIILGRSDVVRRLLRDGYPINSRSEGDKNTALMWAVRNKDLEMINLLVRNGADITLLDENDDNVALIAVQSSSWEQNDFLDFWNSIDRKIDLGHANTSGNTILHYARERSWDVLAKMIGTDSGAERGIEQAGVGSCVCCFCKPPRGGATHKTREKNAKAFPPDEMESTLSHLTVLFDEIVNRYRETWARDRNLGYPGFRGGHGDSAATIEDLMSLRREEIARLNTILPKLEESYLQKLRDCWSSLVSRMRLVAGRDRERFGEYVTSIQIQLLTHEVCPRTENFGCDVTDRAASVDIDENSSRRNHDFSA